jgi:hypothetical protein
MGLRTKTAYFPVDQDRPPEGGKGRHAMQNVRTLPIAGGGEVAVSLDELAREGACRMIVAALEVEVEQYVASFVGDFR